jgi:energy-coupling factor transport system permease protein
MNSLFGRFVNINSPIHKLDPRTKLLVNLFFAILLIYLKSPADYFLAGLFVLISMLFSKISPIKYLEGLKAILFLIIFSMILQTIFTVPTNHNDLIWHFGFIKIAKSGIINGIAVAFRFLFMIFLTTVFTATTTSAQITESIRNLLKPLKIIKLPVEEFAIMLSIALRFIPILADEYQNIIDAQKSRGLNLTSGNLYVRAKKFIPIFIPLIVRSFQKAENLAEVMEVRGFKDADKRTHFHQLEYSYRDLIVLIAFILLVIGIWYF